MARTVHKLTDTMVRRLSEPGLFGDGGGLYLQVARNGSKSWIYRFRRHGRSREMGLGSARVVTLPQARARAAEARLLRDQGVDPIEARNAKPQTSVHAATAPSGPKFAEFAESYVEGRRHDWKTPKTGNQWLATLQAYVFPVVGELHFDEIETKHMLTILEPLWRAKPATAGRVRERCERILAAASVEGLRTKPNVALWRGHLQEARGLGKRPKARPHAALRYSEVPAFLTDLRGRDGVPVAALEFLILTASRSNEVRRATWSEIDFEERLWTIDASRMKAGRPHVVPLGDRALAILESMKPLRDLSSGYVFPSARRGSTLSDMTLSSLVRDMGYPCVPHGFRATFKTWSEQETRHDNVVIEAALAHVVGDRTEQAYFRGDYLAKRRSLMDDWGAFCTSEPIAKVVPLSAAGGGQ